MKNYSGLDLSIFQPVNYLWPQLVNKIGLEKSKNAVSQAYDLQRMYGDPSTIPVLFTDTCGIALTSIELLRNQTGIYLYAEKVLLVVSITTKSLQLIRQI